MGAFLEFFLFLGIFFPIYHILNSFFPSSKNNISDKNYTKPMTILIPCYNEKKIIKNTIQGLLKIVYENYECIFINDGSIDDTFKELCKLLKLKKYNKTKSNDLLGSKIKNIYKSKKYSNFYVIDKPNGGKSDALNIGINYSENDYIVTLDADSILKEDALAIVSNVFDDSDVVAASGVIQILQSVKLLDGNYIPTLKNKLLIKLQTIEYIKSCYCYKASLAKLNSLLVISGAFGVFKKKLLIDVGGFSHVIGEDLNLTLKIQFYIENTNKKIMYVPNAICYTEGPDTFKDFIKQRKRWQQSFIESLFTFRKKIFKNFLSNSLSFFIVIDALLIGVISSYIITFFSFLFIRNLVFSNIIDAFLYIKIFILVHLSY
ncbi:MAG TPA: glycosyltransferase, partial [Tenericutes bacterium]|nr:glycosyltransferase [Mycoplasmatota bacterium]